MAPLPRSNSSFSVIRFPIKRRRIESDSEDEITPDNLLIDDDSYDGSPDMFSDSDFLLARESSHLSLNNEHFIKETSSSEESEDFDNDYDANIVVDVDADAHAHADDDDDSSSAEMVIDNPTSSEDEGIQEEEEEKKAEEGRREVQENGAAAADTDTSRKRNRIAKPSEWVKNIRKRKRNHGLEYEMVTGQIRPARQMQPPCSCRKDCSSLIDEGQRQQIFNSFWEIGDVNQQRQLIGKLTVVKKINSEKRRK